MPQYQTEGNFIVAEGAEGELYIYIGAKKDAPIHPIVMYDGYDHAVLVRNEKQKIIFDYINPQIRDKLRKAKAVVIVETILENIKDAYIADMNIVDKIPLDWAKVGLKSWEEAALKA